MIHMNKFVNSVTLNAKRKMDRQKPRCFQGIKKDDGRIELEGQTICLFVYKDGEQKGVGTLT
jgi:recombinational DNA repair ATPase RecF